MSPISKRGDFLTMDASQEAKQQIRRLIDSYKELRNEHEQLTKSHEQLHSEMREAKRYIQQLENDYKRLKLAKAYGWDEKSKKEATNQINKLISDIDICLRQLT